jgi:hypothetical protein
VPTWCLAPFWSSLSFRSAVQQQQQQQHSILHAHRLFFWYSAPFRFSLFLSLIVCDSIASASFARRLTALPTLPRIIWTSLNGLEKCPGRTAGCCRWWLGVGYAGRHMYMYISWTNTEMISTNQRSSYWLRHVGTTTTSWRFSLMPPIPALIT